MGASGADERKKHEHVEGGSNVGTGASAEERKKKTPARPETRREELIRGRRDDDNACGRERNDAASSGGEQGRDCGCRREVVEERLAELSRKGLRLGKGRCWERKYDRKCQASWQGLEERVVRVTGNN